MTTGGEALYADLGHFGEKPIQIDWFNIVGPALVLQYLGQGALLLRHPRSGARIRSTCSRRSGRSIRWSVLAAMATVIASQAIISGVFSLTRQAIQLGYLPRMEIIHTSQRGDRPDLHAVRELDADGRDDRPGHRLPQLDESAPRRTAWP